MDFYRSWRWILLLIDFVFRYFLLVRTKSSTGNAIGIIRGRCPSLGTRRGTSRTSSWTISTTMDAFWMRRRRSGTCRTSSTARDRARTRSRSDWRRSNRRGWVGAVGDGWVTCINWHFVFAADDADELHGYAAGHFEYVAGETEGDPQSVHYPERWQAVDE